MRRAVAGLVLAILVCNALAGCFGDGDPTGEGGVGDGTGDPLIPYTEDGIFTCIDHDNLTRCWQTHVPEDLDPEVAVPLIIDMHTGTPPTPRSTGPYPRSTTSQTRRVRS